jgi:hypothetical protein
MTLQLAAFYVAMNVVAAMYERFSDKSGLTGQQQDLVNQLQSLETGRAYALANTSRTGISADEVNRSYDEQKATLQAKLDAVNAAIKEKENQALNKAQAESERAFQAMLDKAIAQQERIASIANQIPGKNKGGQGSTYAPDRAQELFKLDKGREVDSLFNQAKIDADNYAMALDNVNLKIEIFGLNTETSTERLNIMHERILDLIGRAMEYRGLSGKFEQQAKEMIQNNQQLKAVLDAQRISWSELSKQEKKDFAEKYKDYVADYKALTKLLDLADQLKVKAADAAKEANTIAANTVTTGLSDAATIYQDKIHRLDLQRERSLFELGRYYTDQQQREIDLATAKAKHAEAQKELNRIEAEYGKDSTKWLEQRNNVDKLKESIDKLSQAYRDVYF